MPLLRHESLVQKERVVPASLLDFCVDLHLTDLQVMRQRVGEGVEPTATVVVGKNG
jgi:hypothetical protein